MEPIYMALMELIQKLEILSTEKLAVLKIRIGSKQSINNFLCLPTKMVIISLMNIQYIFGHVEITLWWVNLI